MCVCTDERSKGVVRWEKVVKGAWVRPARKGYRLRCCDCGLVHSVEFRIVDGYVEMLFQRRERETTVERVRILRRQRRDNKRARVGIR